MSTWPQCGTYAGAMRHVRLREPSCEACKAVRAEYMAARRFRMGSQHDPSRCHACGSVFRQHACTVGGIR